jgi:hypothetical protein
MKIENEDSFIRFEDSFKDNLTNDIGCLYVEVFSKGFGGSTESVWFSEKDVKPFLEQIQELDKTRKGSANLLNMSSGSDANPLDFTIFSTDSLGHLAIRATLRKLAYLSNFADILKVSVSFEIEPNLLPSIIRDFKKLFMI